jgi:hypothetical protein
MRKYLCFLDIDGVLTSQRVHKTYQGEYGMWCQFDPIAVQFFNWIHDTYPVEFVLMSTWKNGLRNDGFRGEFASPWKTDPDNFAPVKKWDRGNEVKDYLETYATDVDDFVLFDDNRYRFNEILGKRRLVQTDADNGLLHKHMLNAVSLMGTWEKKNV